MIGGVLVGFFCFASLALLTWQLMKAAKKQELRVSSLSFRTAVVGVLYAVQLAVVMWFSTSGGAYNWFREQGLPPLIKADTAYVTGFSGAIFVSALLLFWFLQIIEKRK